MTCGDDTRARAAAWFDERARLCEGVKADLDSLGRLIDDAVAQAVAEREAVWQAWIADYGVTIRKQAEEIARLRAALEPFAKRAEYFDGKFKAGGDAWGDEDVYADDVPSTIYLGQLRAARAALHVPGRMNEKPSPASNTPATEPIDPGPR